MPIHTMVPPKPGQFFWIHSNATTGNQKTQWTPQFQQVKRDPNAMDTLAGATHKAVTEDDRKCHME